MKTPKNQFQELISPLTVSMLQEKKYAVVCEAIADNMAIEFAKWIQNLTILTRKAF